MSEYKNPSETILRKSVTVTVVDEDGASRDITIKEFAFAKTLKVFALVGELAASANVGQAVAAANQDGAAGAFEAEAPMATNFISTLLELLPAALKNGVPAVYKLIGLIPLTNKELKELEKGDDDLDAVLLERGRDFAYDYGIEEVVTLVSAAIQVIGIETIVRNVGPLLRMLRANAG